ncbi:AFG1/ZapE family ATPase, partial [Clavibacter michiganensis]|uniref:AFG1/ZapE family ATPase n=1 Tax=Clavibacter michiganensis TaxID=28447 RepID=UPI00292ED04A
MTSTPATTGLIHLTDREPAVSGAEMVSALVPPPQFDGATFESYRADAAYPSQQEAKELLQAFAGKQSAPAKKGGFFRRAEKTPPVKPSVYLDGGFGVGKTHLLAAIYHAMPARRKYFGSFIEYTALVGVLGYAKAV